MTVKIENLEVSNDAPLILIAGPCVIESETLAQEVAGTVKEITNEYNIPYIFKSSFDKANRTSLHSYRGPGIEDGLRILQSVKDKINVPVLTDVHEDTPLDEVSSVVDVLQTPAFLCRQTNFILKVAAQNKPVNIKKGQFLSPWDMENVVKKAKSQGNNNILVCERGYSFGYNNLVSDMRSLVIHCNCQVVKAMHQMAKENIFNPYPEQQLRLVLLEYLLRHTQTQTMRLVMDQILYRLMN